MRPSKKYYAYRRNRIKKTDANIANLFNSIDRLLGENAALVVERDTLIGNLQAAITEERIAIGNYMRPMTHDEIIEWAKKWMKP